MLAAPLGRLGVALTRWAYRHGTHTYLSTSCLHGDCGYCQTVDGRAGTKKPAACKFCDQDGRCVCRCHKTPRHASHTNTPR